MAKLLFLIFVLIFGSCSDTTSFQPEISVNVSEYEWWECADSDISWLLWYGNGSTQAGMLFKEKIEDRFTSCFDYIQGLDEGDVAWLHNIGEQTECRHGMCCKILRSDTSTAISCRND